MESKPSPHYISAVTGIIDEVANMPKCIYDVLRARMTLTSEPVIETINDRPYRIGIPVEVLIQDMKAITERIHKERYGDGYQSEDSASWS